LDYLFNIVVFIIVLGELVFFHEMGHFLAAKACGIYCERFSLGMPPRLFGFRFGETDYCIGLLPIGGYVKMAGQEDVPMSDEERKEHYGNIPPDRWFSSKPVWQRVIVIAAGPFMNLVLAVILYGIVAAVGANVPEYKVDNRIGMIRPDSPAAGAMLFEASTPGELPDLTGEPDAYGWQTGDRIVSINGKPVSNISDVAIDAVLSAGQAMLVELERTDSSGSVKRFMSQVQPLRQDEEDHPQFGVAPFQTALVGRVLAGSAADEAGLQADDIITHADGGIVDSQTFTDLVNKNTERAPMELRVLRNGEALQVTITPAVVGQLEGIQFTAPHSFLAIPDPENLAVVFSSPEFDEATDLRDGDKIVTIDGEPANARALTTRSDSDLDKVHTVTLERTTGLFGGKTEKLEKQLTLAQIRQAVTPYDLQSKPVIADLTDEVAKETGLLRNDVVETIDGEPATLEGMRVIDSRPGEMIVMTVRTPEVGFGVLRGSETKEVEIEIVPAGQIGVNWAPKMVFHRAAPAEVIPEAFRLSWQALTRTVRTLELLVTGGLKMNDIGGPVMIFQITTQAARIGYSWLLEITAFISINLAVFNLLPLPVLDGGHLAFLSIEAVRRKPVSPRVMEWVQQAGLVLIIALMLFVTFNDVKRWFFGTFLP
jgi:regulator of sigma E protease